MDRQLTASSTAPSTAADSGNQKAKNNTVLWSLTDENGESTKLASVNNRGQVTTQKNIAEKTVFVVTAAAKSMPEQTASIRITVIPAAAKVNVTAGRDVVYTNEGYNVLQLAAAVEPADAGQRVTWTSSAPKVMTVDENGLVTALSPGRATITAAAEDGSRKSGKISLQAGEAAERIDIAVPMTLLRAGDSMKLDYSFGYDPTGRFLHDHPEKFWEKANPVNKEVEWTLFVDKPEAEPCVSLKNGKLTVAKECPACEVKVTISALGGLPGKDVSESVRRFVRPEVSGSPVDSAEPEDFYGVWRIAEVVDEAGNSFEPGEKLLMGAGMPEDFYWYEVGYMPVWAGAKNENKQELCMAEGLENTAAPVALNGGALYFGEKPMLTLRDDGTIVTDFSMGGVRYEAVLYRVEEDFHRLTLQGDTQTEFDAESRPVRSTDYYVDGGVMAVTEYTYDESGSLAEEVTRDAAGEETRRRTCEYDGDGNLTAETVTVNGAPEGRDEYLYDENGRRVREDHYGKDGFLAWYNTSEYDAEGREIKMEQHDRNGFVYLWRSAEYNDHGDLVRNLWYGPDNRVDYTLDCRYYEYDYDGNGRVTERRIYGYNEDGTTYLATVDHPNRP